MNNGICLAMLTAAALAACGEITAPASGDGDGGVGNPAAAPKIASVTPSRGAIGGGTEVTITGSDFAADMIVIVGDVVASDVSFVSETELSITAPAGFVVDQALSVLVYGENGFGELRDAFTYNAAPTADTVSPAFGPLAGGRVVEIRGKFFQNNNDGPTVVTFGGVASPTVDVIDDTTIHATTPAGIAADVALAQQVVVNTPNGDAVIDDAFSYVRPGLLYSTKVRGGGSFGLFYFDIETRRSLRLAELGDAFSRILVDGNGEILVRHNRLDNLFQPSQWARIDVNDGSATDLPGISVNDVGNQVNISAVANLGGSIFAANSSQQFGSLAVPEMVFTRIGVTNLPTPGRGCFAPGPNNTVIFLGRDSDPIRSIPIATGVSADGATLSGDLPAGQSFPFGCHGAASIGTAIFALFTNAGIGSQLSAAAIFSINRVTGVAVKIADLPAGSSGLQPTPLQGF